MVETRKVSLDNVVKIRSVPYEIPRGYRDTTLELRRHTIDGRVCIVHEGRVVQVHPVDLAANAEALRASAKPTLPADEEGEVPVTAASLAFDRDFGPVRR